jgi:hypothetical protein
MSIDLLLLNCTNLPWRPIYPYAFVQVGALARQAGLVVRTVDLLQIPRDRWEHFLQPIVAASQPRAVGLHIRQGDSVYLDDYLTPPSRPPNGHVYFPIEDNRELVRIIRRGTPAPVIAGGFGFTTHAKRLFEYLELDFGVQGCPDEVLRNFESVLLRRDLRSVQSLMFREDGVTQSNPRGYFGPLDEREYNDAVVNELVRFYGHAQLYGAHPPTVAVEVMRGCPFGCYFCTEPHVKGRRLRYRSQEVVEAELDFLLSHGLRRFWLICSELDIQGPGFALELAERIIRLRERHPGAPIEWSGYVLPRLKESDLRTLQRAGYVGALNEVLSLDDDNLRAARVPYRANQAVAFLKAVTKLEKEDAAEAARSAATPRVNGAVTYWTPKDLASVFGLFLGNAFADERTLQRTLRRIDAEGLKQNYRMGVVIPGTRVFEPDGVPICPTTAQGLRSYDAKGERAVDTLWPTFYFPPYLLQRLGNPGEVLDFCAYVGETFMSNGHRSRKDWSAFLIQHSSAEEFERLLTAALAAHPLGADTVPSLPGPAAAILAQFTTPTVALIRQLLSPPPLQKARWNAVAQMLLAHIFRSNLTRVGPVLQTLELPHERIDPGWSELCLTEHLSRRFESKAALLSRIIAQHGEEPLERLFVESLLYANNIVLRRDYSELLFGSQCLAATAV